MNTLSESRMRYVASTVMWRRPQKAWQAARKPHSDAT